MNTQPPGMDDEELSHRLAEKNAAVVHFSHHAAMREGGVFPDDLRAAIANRNEWALSCCVVWPGHGMDVPGSVGVIFDPTVTAVLSVCADDSGSSTLQDGSEGSLGVPLNVESFEACFRPRLPGYNEWRIRGAGVRGIYVENPAAIYVKKRQSLEVDGREWSDIGSLQISLGEVFAAFPGKSVYTMGPDGLVELKRPNQ